MKTFKLTSRILLTIISLFVLLGQIAYSQDQFRLSDYTNPDYRWHQLDVNVGLGGANQFDYNEFDDGTTGSKVNNSQLSNSFNGNYYGTRNSLHYQGYQQAGISLNYNLSGIHKEQLDYDDMDDKSNTWNLGTGFYGNSINRFYNHKMMFLETDLDVSYFYSGNKTENNDEFQALPYIENSKANRNVLDVSLPLLVGIGRIEQIQDARLAVYILDDLSRSGDLSRTATAEETLAFAQFITNTKNQRFFDTRLRKIAEITSIDSFLTVRGLKAASDASYYTLINDDWDYANGPVRASGSRFSIGAIPALAMNYQKLEQVITEYGGNEWTVVTNTYLDKTDIIHPSLALVTMYTFEMPSSLYWQHSVSAKGYYKLSRENYDYQRFIADTLNYNDEYEINSPDLDLRVEYTIGFYPNSRTTVTLGILSEYNRQWGEKLINEDEEHDLSQTAISNDLALNCYYYISPQLRFELGIISSYLFNKVDESDQAEYNGIQTHHKLNNMVSARFTYSIF